MDSLESTVRDGVDHLIPLVEAVGAIVIAAGVLVAVLSYLLALLHVRPATYEQIRLQLAHFIALGIEFQLASDVLGTAVSPSFEEIGRLGAIAGIRTLLNYFLAMEIARGEGAGGSMRGFGPGDGVTPRLWRGPWGKRGTGRRNVEVGDR